MFERPITFQHGDGSTSPRRVDCYRRGHFVWESKKLKAGIQSQASGAAPTRASTTRSCAPAPRPRTTPGPCPPPRTARPSWWWWTSATSSSCTPSSPAPAPPTRRFPTPEATASAWSSCRPRHPRAAQGAVDRPAQPGPQPRQRPGHAHRGRRAGRFGPRPGSRRPRTAGRGRLPHALPVQHVFAEDVGLLPLAAIEAGFKGKGPWKKGLPRILETLEALGRARQEGGSWRG